MKKCLILFSTLFLSGCLASCGEETAHKHKFGYLIPEVEATCEAQGVKAHYHCDSCGKDFDEGKNEILDLKIPALGHNFVLTNNEFTYKCRRCNETMKSGKEEIKFEQKTRLFIGSSLRLKSLLFKPRNSSN